MNRIQLVAALLCGCVWLSGMGCATQRENRNASPPRQPEQQRAQLPSLQVETEGLRLTWLEPGTPSQTVWEAVVPRAEAKGAQAGATGVFENVQCVLYEKGQPTTDLRAAQVRALQKQWRIEATGGVRARSRVNGVNLQAKEVIWLARQNRLIARGDVVITGKQFSLRAQEVELDTALQMMRVSSP
jgi:lipopolysaccharide assembly outer membrane protein LptD (OstA)